MGSIAKEVFLIIKKYLKTLKHLRKKKEIGSLKNEKKRFSRNTIESEESHKKV